MEATLFFTFIDVMNIDQKQFGRGKGLLDLQVVEHSKRKSRKNSVLERGGRNQSRDHGGIFFYLLAQVTFSYNLRPPI